MAVFPEIIHTDVPTGSFQCVLFDFDGTISLIREGWQGIMIPLFIELLADTPRGRQETDAFLQQTVREFVFIGTGKQTIYQCISLAEHIEQYGGTPSDPMLYKDEYIRRLMLHIDNRRRGLGNGSLSSDDLMVPGSRALLNSLRDRGLTLYLASGTDIEHVRQEAELLGITEYFLGCIYGALRDYKNFSKAMVIRQIIQEHNLSGIELLGFGDGYVEIEEVKKAGGFACGVASNEAERVGIDDWKRERLIRAGADLIIPDYHDLRSLETYLF